ncbi:MAG: OB-fold domain-containing protein [Bordetella sp.]|nr:OB-fold domain-containing protein [Bordetella sp.]
MTNEYQARVLSPLVRDAASEPFWAAAAEGVLKIRRCTVCERAHHYPRALCPYCQGDTRWEPASGLGTIYSVSLTRRAGPVPYAVAYVRLAEDVTMLANIVNCDLAALRIGDAVKVCFVTTEDGAKVPMFEPA